MISRRRFIQALKSASVGVPLYAQLAHRAIAESQPAQPNILFNFFPEGITPELFFPQAGAISQLPEMSAPLQPVAQHCTLIDGISMFGAADIHASQAHLLTGGDDTSLDNYLGADLKGKSSKAFGTLRLGAFSNQLSQYSNSFAGGKQLHHEDSPELAYKICFGNGPSREDALALSGLKETIGSDAKQVVEQQLDGLASIAAKIPPLNLRGLSANRNYSDVEAPSDIATVVDIQQDIIAMALSCGLSHCVSFMLGHANWPVTPLDGKGRTSTNYTKESATPYIQWYMERLYRLLLKLRALPGQHSASLLDETYVLTYSNNGILVDDMHDRMPFILSGGHNFGHQGGFTLDYRQHSNSNVVANREHPAELVGLPHTQLLTSIALAMGLHTDGIGIAEARGGFSNGPLPNFWQRSAV